MIAVLPMVPYSAGLSFTLIYRDLTGKREGCQLLTLKSHHLTMTDLQSEKTVQRMKKDDEGIDD